MLIALLLIASGLVALASAAGIADSEMSMSHARHLRVAATANTLWLVFLLIQIPIVWLMTNLIFSKPLSRLLQIPLSLLVSVACSLCIGFLLLISFEDGWFFLADRLTKN
jgi:uncharacterized membrane protein